MRPSGVFQRGRSLPPGIGVLAFTLNEPGKPDRLCPSPEGKNGPAALPVPVRAAVGSTTRVTHLSFTSAWLRRFLLSPHERAPLRPPAYGIHTSANIAAALAILKDHYRTKVATSGAKALEHAAAADKPDQILLDVTMPEMDGYEVCARLKADPQTAAIPVVFLTARTEAEDEAKGFELGSVDYIHKPFNPTVVRARVATHLLLRDTLKEIEERNAALDEKTRMLESLSAKLSKYLSPQVYASIFAGSRDVELATERKRLTVFLSNIKDFVATTADMRPEDLTAMLSRYFTAMSKIAFAYRAHIDKFIGDAMDIF
jgi:adenylate cyclase